MKNRFSKFISKSIVVVSLTGLIFSTPSYTGASNKIDSSEPSIKFYSEKMDYKMEKYLLDASAAILGSVKTMLGEGGIYSEDISFGAPISVDIKGSLYYIPVIVDSKIEMFVCVGDLSKETAGGSGYSITIGKLFSDEFHNLDSSQPYKIATYENDLYAVSETETVLLKRTSFSEIDANKDDDSEMQSLFVALNDDTATQEMREYYQSVERDALELGLDVNDIRVAKSFSNSITESGVESISDGHDHFINAKSLYNSVPSLLVGDISNAIIVDVNDTTHILNSIDKISSEPINAAANKSAATMSSSLELYIPYIHSIYQNQCWSETGLAASLFYGPAKPGYDTIENIHNNISHGCSEISDCNYAGPSQTCQILLNNGRNAYEVYPPMGYDSIKALTNLSRPVVAVLKIPAVNGFSQRGHQVVVRGYSDDYYNFRVLLFMDPDVGYTSVLYSMWEEEFAYVTSGKTAYYNESIVTNWTK